MPDDAALLERARMLDPAALAEIHDTLYTPIFRYVRMRVFDRETAEDLTSDVFTRLLTALHAGTAPQTTLRGWLFGVASNVVADHHRRSYRAPVAPLSDNLSGGSSPEHAEDIFAREALLGAVGELTPEQQEVIALRFGSGMPIRDVADQIGKSEGAVKQLQARAMAQLAKKLAPFGQGGEV